eukprot:jgi/Ulvmu1/582/UM001_0590.1
MPRSRAPRDLCIRSELAWTKRRPRPAADDTQATQTDIPFESDSIEEILQHATKVARELTPRAGDEDVVTLDGLAALVVSDRDSGPDFSAAGYFLETATRECWAVSIKVMVPRVDCQQEAIWGILLVQLHNHKRSVSIGALAERHGTDALSLCPLDKSSHQFLCPGVAPDATPQARFRCTMIKGQGGAAADVPAWCQPLLACDHDVINLGLMAVAGVPLRVL